MLTCVNHLQSDNYTKYCVFYNDDHNILCLTR